MARRFYRPDDALLAGVCAELARRLGWNVWALRVLFLAALLVQTLPTAAVYAVAAVIMGLVLGDRSPVRGREGGVSAADDLRSEPLAERSRRIQALEEKFRDLEREQR
ncbi:MAG: PspC domain-containing protein [Xanthomonadales bacterium]|jgi:phage shock protein PspC (stress-responsive transcriptional regulator)|nr:PspC domain-containing protein [Xanthomonadales bacterium]